MVFIFACLLCSYVNLNAQEKYAVLITGDYAVSPEEGIPISSAKIVSSSNYKSPRPLRFVPFVALAALKHEKQPVSSAFRPRL